MPFCEVNGIHYHYEIMGPDPKEKNDTGFPLPLVLTPWLLLLAMLPNKRRIFTKLEVTFTTSNGKLYATPGAWLSSYAELDREQKSSFVRGPHFRSRRTA